MQAIPFPLDVPACVVAYCRAGFESEAAEDLRRAAAGSGSGTQVEATARAGYVVAKTTLDGPAVERALRAAPPIFARTVFLAADPVSLTAIDAGRRGGPRPDRVAPLLAAIDALATVPFDAPPWRDVWVEYPDTNEGKALSPLARALASRLEGELARRNALRAGARRRLHVFLVDGATAYVGSRDAGSDSPWPLGIPRLRMPGAAPSRSTQKLAEAVATFLGDDASKLLRPGMRAVDLGASPGGWTWQLVQRGLTVTAVDNGLLKGDIAIDPRVTHIRADGLTFRPRKPVDWLVCDIVLQPSRIAELVARWIAQGDARRAIFNLKLPMKKRYDAVHDCESRIVERMRKAHVRCELALRQLYHDREEVTGYLARLD